MCSVLLHHFFFFIKNIWLFLPSRCEFQVVKMSCFAPVDLLNMQWTIPQQPGAPAKTEDETVSWETKVKGRGNESTALRTIAKIQISGDFEILHEHQFRMPIVWVVLVCVGLPAPVSPSEGSIVADQEMA